MYRQGYFRFWPDANGPAEGLAPTRTEALFLPGAGFWAQGRLVALTESAALFSDGSLTLDEAVAFSVDRCVTAELVAAASLDIYSRIWRGFARFSRLAADVDTVSAVDASVVARYLAAPTRSGRAPQAATRQLRRTAIAFLFRVLRDNGLVHHDPTLDLGLPSRPKSSIRPLTNDEVERCRSAAPATLLATREPAAWALMETGGSTAEVGSVRHRDLDLDAGTVVLGHSTPIERVVPLTPWGAKHLRRRSHAASSAEWVLLQSLSVDDNSRRTRATELVRNVTRRAGISGPGVSARSLTAWAGREILAETGRIEDVAKRLGFSSIDRTAELIGHDWNTRP